MVGNNGLVRALNLDENEIAVTIGGRGFVLKQQAKVPLMRVLDAMFKSESDDIEAAKSEEGDEGEKPALEESVQQTFIKAWDKAIPVFAMMFGYKPEKEDEWNEVVQFLEEHLAPMAGVKIHRAWWELNEIDSFFIRCGRTMLHPEMELGIEAELKRQLSERVRRQVSEAIEASEATSSE